MAAIIGSLSILDKYDLGGFVVYFKRISDLIGYLPIADQIQKIGMDLLEIFLLPISPKSVPSHSADRTARRVLENQNWSGFAQGFYFLNLGSVFQLNPIHR